MAMTEAPNLQNNSLFKLRHGIFFVEGATRAALYDTPRGNVYSLNQDATQIVKGERDNQEFWSSLVSMELAVNQRDFKIEQTTSEIEIPKPTL